MDMDTSYVVVDRKDVKGDHCYKRHCAATWSRLVENSSRCYCVRAFNCRRPRLLVPVAKSKSCLAE